MIDRLEPFSALRKTILFSRNYEVIGVDYSIEGVSCVTLYMPYDTASIDNILEPLEP